MSLSCTVSEIWFVICRKSQVANISLPHTYLFNRFQRTPACARRTDRRTYIGYNHEHNIRTHNQFTECQALASCMSVYRIDVGITGGRCYRAVEVKVVWKLGRQIRFQVNPFTTGDRNLLLEAGRLSIRTVSKSSSVPRGSFRKFRVVLDATALPLNRAYLIYSNSMIFYTTELVPMSVLFRHLLVETSPKNRKFPPPKKKIQKSDDGLLTP